MAEAYDAFARAGEYARARRLLSTKPQPVEPVEEPVFATV